MQVMYEQCAGPDVHKKTVVACVLTPAGQETRTLGTMTSELLGLSDWPLVWGCTHVAMESTGDYVRRITARAISLAEGTGPEGNPWVNDSPSSESQKGTAACRRSGAAQKPCMVRLCQTRVLW
jgi:hypothetical protein